MQLSISYSESATTLFAVYRHSCARLEPPRRPLPGFFVEPSRWWAFVYDHNMQGTHCREAPSFTGAGTPPPEPGSATVVRMVNDSLSESGTASQ